MRIVVPAGKALGNCRPLVTTLGVESQEEGILLRLPVSVRNGGFEVVVIAE